jgi:hypothetical protein
MRKYLDFVGWAESFLKKSSWAELLEKVTEVQNSVGGYNKSPQISQGKVRDGLLELLALQDMKGLDVDLLDVLKQIDGTNLQEVREAARGLCIQLLREQIRIGNTFFLDADVMKESELTVLIPGVLEARIREIRNLETNPPLSDVYSTYYGFSILTSGGIVEDFGGVPKDTREQLIDVMQRIGNVENISAKQLKFSYLSFRNCSDQLKVILWNLLKMCIGGIKSQKAAIETLGKIGDSRGIVLMNSRLQNVKDRKVKELLFETIGKIGSPKSYDTVLSQIEDGRNLDALKALGGLRDGRVAKVLEGFSKNYYWRDQESYFEALGNTRDSRWLPYLQEKSTGRRRSRSNAVPIAIRRIEEAERLRKY